MILIKNIISIYVIILIIIFYLFSYYQRSKLLYLFRSINYHFSNLFFSYNSDDLLINKINYYSFFYLFQNFIIISVIANYLFFFQGDLRGEFLDIINEKIKIYIYLSVLLIISLRSLIIEYIIGLFIDSKLKFIFFRNYVISIIISILMITNLFIYVLNDFYNFEYLRLTLYFFILLHIYFQFKNYLSYFLNKGLKEVMYLILYLCAFKLAPWIWLYSVSY